MKASQEKAGNQTVLEELIVFPEETSIMDRPQSSEQCPECGSPVYRGGGCPLCMCCGWSACG